MPPPVFLAFTPWELDKSLLPHKGWSGVHFPKDQILTGRTSREEERGEILGEFQAEASVPLACFAGINEVSGSGGILALALFFACISEC